MFKDAMVVINVKITKSIQVLSREAVRFRIRAYIPHNATVSSEFFKSLSIH